MKNKIAILGMPRSGTSLMANLLISSRYFPSAENDVELIQASEFNYDGYFESVKFTLLNDQLIRIKSGSYFSSFLSPQDIFTKNKDFIFEEYDVDEINLVIPDDFLGDIKKYCGTDWDCWGISRMVSGGKWNKCYSKYSIRTLSEIKKEIKKQNNIIKEFRNNLFLKDPRLSLVFENYKNSFNKIIWIQRRDDEKHLKSLRGHYGPFFLTNTSYKGYGWVSNHFNFKIKPSCYQVFKESYTRSLNTIRSYFQGDIFECYFEDLINDDGSIRDRLQDFIGEKINFNLIRNV